MEHRSSGLARVGGLPTAESVQLKASTRNGVLADFGGSPAQTRAGRAHRTRRARSYDGRAGDGDPVLFEPHSPETQGRLAARSLDVDGPVLDGQRACGPNVMARSVAFGNRLTERRRPARRGGSTRSRTTGRARLRRERRDLASALTRRTTTVTVDPLGPTRTVLDEKRKPNVSTSEICGAHTRAGAAAPGQRMNTDVTLHGYKFSVYNRIARVALEEKTAIYAMREVDPFSQNLSETYRRLHPFGRVPVLTHGDFVLYETSAIERYIDQAFGAPSLTPTAPKAAARMAQVIAIVDNYGYWPMVRQVFAHRVFRPLIGEAYSETEVSDGLVACRKVLEALEAIAQEGYVLNGNSLTLADCHLGPIVDYFMAAPEGAAMLSTYGSLWNWWAFLSRRASMVETDPGRPEASI